MTNVSSEDFNGAAKSAFLPTVVEQTKNGERGYDLFSRMMKDNVIMVTGPIRQDMASIIVAQLLFLGAQNAGKGEKGAISMYIDSPGGSVDAGMAIYDAMNFVQAQYGIPVRTIGLGMNMSMGSFLLCAGTKGYRAMLPNSDHMVHQPSAGSQGKVSDMAITQDSVDETKQRLALLYVAHTNMDYETVKKISDRDSFLRAEECVKLGLVDTVMYADDIVTKHKASGKVDYAPGVAEHLERISKFHRETNLADMAARAAAEADRGPYTQLTKTLK